MRHGDPMLRNWLRRPERALLVSAAALTALLILGFALSGLASQTPARGPGSGWGSGDDQHVVVSRMLSVEPGKVVHVDLSSVSKQCKLGTALRSCASAPGLAAYEGAVEFYVVESGEGQAFSKGSRPERVYASGNGGGLWTSDITFLRPAPPASKASLPTTWKTSGGATVTVPGINAPNGLEFVFVLPPGPVQGVEYDTLAPGSFDVQGAVRTFEPWLPTAQVGLAILEAMAGAWLAWSWVAWARRRPVPVPAEARGSEALLHLMSRAQGYLQGLRTSLLVTGVLLTILGFIVAFLLSVEAASIARLSPFPAWPLAMGLGALVSFGGLAAVWYGQYRAVTAELRRWEARMASAPRLGEDA